MKSMMQLHPILTFMSQLTNKKMSTRSAWIKEIGKQSCELCALQSSDMVAKNWLGAQQLILAPPEVKPMVQLYQGG